MAVLCMSEVYARVATFRLSDGKRGQSALDVPGFVAPVCAYAFNAARAWLQVFGTTPIYGGVHSFSL